MDQGKWNLWRRLFGAPARPAVPAGRPSRAAAPEPAAEAAGPAPAEPIRLERLADLFHRFVLGLPEDREAGAIREGEQALLRRLQALTERFDVRSLPRLPTVLPQLLRMLRNDNSAGSQLAALIGRDPVLVGEVMRVTGSAHYRTAQPIHSLQHAVVLLGQEGLRRVATQHVMKPILQASAGMHGHMAGQHLWDHAERCAHASAWLGRQLGCEPFEAYLVGMVCHAGTGAVVRLLDQEAPPAAAPYSGPFLAGAMQLGAQLSLRAAEYWELPAGVARALTERAEAATPPASPLGRALQAADALAMAQLLAERGRLEPEADLSRLCPDTLNPALLQRCQQDLRRQFREAA
ncbi:HDOD domain-containing protein [Fulvimonas soli]|jgi:HD-like signal output (HDOD) protein|uniref:HD-like signal output (HDOD) protein n=1 Tax=Fulvimonas soli TaxID=155197 RepID=A0A316I519_9GAMM|nr:HDOD domain-containing protein [Fulvimonas soli]PWK87797.1 HD-like signal output (HDOD) protein [Fulvimonas soli]TNY24944.1 histidine kinase [Fulvimonas soli]